MSRMRYCGREFTETDIELIQRLLVDNTSINRSKLSRLFCEAVGWRKADGGLKDMSCRVALLRMHRDGHIELPPPQKPANNHLKIGKRTLLALSQPEVTKKAGEHVLQLQLVEKADSAIWNEYIDRYHYLGYTPLPGAQLRYFVKSGDQVLALLGFGAAAWKTAPRDDYISWDAEARKRNLHLIINNARFLILPWVHSKNLGSKILSMASRRICGDWLKRYNYEPVLLETFVEKERFQGTCYKAANWIYVGDTQGRGKLDVHNEYKLPVKGVWLYPLKKDFRKRLIEG
jgi:Druantia protein DruA